MRTGETFLGTPVCCASIMRPWPGYRFVLTPAGTPEQQVALFGLRGCNLATGVVLVARPSGQQHSYPGKDKAGHPEQSKPTVPDT